MARERFGAASRHWERWTLGEGNVVRALQVLIPDSELGQFTSKEASPMAWIPAPGAGRGVVFSVFVAEPPDAFNWEHPETSGELVGTMISKSRFTWVVHKAQEINPETRHLIEDGRAKALQMAAGKVPQEAGLDLRMALWGTRDKEDFFFVELNAKEFAKQGATNAS